MVVLVQVEEQTLLPLLVFQVLHDHSQQRYVALRFSLVHTYHFPQALSVGCQVSLGVDNLALEVFHVRHVNDHKLPNSQVHQGAVGHIYQVSQV